MENDERKLGFWLYTGVVVDVLIWPYIPGGFALLVPLVFVGIFTEIPRLAQEADIRRFRRELRKSKGVPTEAPTVYWDTNDDEGLD